MAFKSDVPPHESARPIDPPAPLEDARPNMAMLKADIDSGRTGDKVTVFDPGMAMLGTCEEAAGTPLTPEQVKVARLEETKRRWRFGRPNARASQNTDSGAALSLFIALIALIGVVLVGGIWISDRMLESSGPPRSSAQLDVLPTDMRPLAPSPPR